MKSPQQALNETVMKWFDKGFYGFTDKAGRKWRADVYARNIITSTSYRVYNEMRTRASEEMGVETFYYSKKAAARPACAGLQHRIVTKGAAFTEKGVEVLSLLDHGYGEAGGCLGINCRHTLTPFIIGVNQLPDQAEHLKDITPEQAIENGKQQAKQRAFEREIRKNQERLNVAKQLDYVDMIDKFKARASYLQGGLNQLLKDNPFLYRDTMRGRLFKGDYLEEVRKNLQIRREKMYNRFNERMDSPVTRAQFENLMSRDLMRISKVMDEHQEIGDRLQLREYKQRQHALDTTEYLKRVDSGGTPSYFTISEEEVYNMTLENMNMMRLFSDFQYFNSDVYGGFDAKSQTVTNRIKVHQAYGKRKGLHMAPTEIKERK
ncbi:MAG: phage minor capsid protein [Streptococcaceae bacterium]|jgi:hypothetical protein|nr:phage minor capsid protein [Streptococcaceae bacterium]